MTRNFASSSGLLHATAAAATAAAAAADNTMSASMLALSCLAQQLSSVAQQVGGQAWPPAVAPSAVVQDLHREYNNIFRHGNRNAASHLWASFLLNHAPSMSTERLELMFSGFCAVSGSPVQPSDYTRYRLTLPLVAGGNRSGYMYYCCWPCVCDTQDFIRIDTKNVTTAAGERQYHFAVLGNPCEHRERLRETFTQPFERRGETTLEREAPEVRCGEDGTLLGATLSDHGHTIISMFFDAAPTADEAAAAAAALPAPDGAASGEAAVGVAAAAPRTPTPGRMSTAADGTNYHDMGEWGASCTDRANNGYNSGMGEIFRKVAAITPVLLRGQGGAAALPPPAEEKSEL